VHILHVEDDRVLAATFARALRGLGHSVTTVHDCNEATQCLTASRRSGVLIDAVILDLMLEFEIVGEGGQREKHTERGDSLIPFVARLHPRAVIAVVSGHVDAELALRLAGQSILVVPKDLGYEQVVELARVLQERHAACERRLAAFLTPFGLTEREVEVFLLGVAGLDTKDVAFELGLAEYTVRRLWSTIFTKMEALNVYSQTQALAALVRALLHS